MTPHGGFAHERTRGLTDEWFTPPAIFEALGLRFDLDPCSPLAGPVPWVPADRFLTARENGLLAPWDGTIWCNPPYGPETGRWLRRLAGHGDGIALVCARTDTRWFHDVAPQAQVLCFIRGRVQFWRPEQGDSRSNTTAPSVILAFGDRCAQAVRQSGLGLMVAPLLASATNNAAAGLPAPKRSDIVQPQMEGLL